ncbi:MAG TPA: DinB family protein [Thermoanaerobaculia bacterium]|nr:DinB family protein [Thermoanaerobaculia bacterium]
MKWEHVRRLHAESAAQVAATAEAIPPDSWLTPRAEGKWSPAEIVHHLLLTFDTLQREMEGGKGMHVITRLWQRVLLRLFLVPRLLRGGAFPKRARAPRELRPGPPSGTQAEVIAKFRARAAEFEAAADEAQKRPRGGVLTHAYFGRSNVATGVLLCARHMQHHQRQLASDSQRLPAG